jgi:hypothetical protein
MGVHSAGAGGCLTDENQLQSRMSDPGIGIFEAFVADLPGWPVAA